MGWHGQRLPGGGSIWARGDLSCVEVRADNGTVVEVPREYLFDLVGEYIKSLRIRHLEDMSPREVLGLGERE